MFFIYLPVISFIDEIQQYFNHSIDKLTAKTKTSYNIFNLFNVLELKMN